MSMMKRVAYGLGGTLALVLVAGGGAYLYAGSATAGRLGHTWPDVVGKDLPIPYPLTEAEIEVLRQERSAAAPTAAAADPSAAPADPLAGVDLQAIAQERAVARATALVNGRVPCGECHGADGAGTLVADAMPVWKWHAPNITRGGVTKDYQPADWDRAIRHGVKRDGTTSTMPSIDFIGLSDQEVSDLAAYYWSLPPIDTPQAAIQIGPLGRFLIGFGQMPLSVEMIDHTLSHRALPPPAAVDVEFGGHIVAVCAGCHRTDYTGGPILQGPPDWPPAANLTPHEEGLQGWTEEDFIRVFREAKSKDGRELREPMASIREMQITDVELKAMFLFLQQLEPKPTAK
jgi:cytochrome c553